MKRLSTPEIQDLVQEVFKLFKHKIKKAPANSNFTFISRWQYLHGVNEPVKVYGIILLNDIFSETSFAISAVKNGIANASLTERVVVVCLKVDKEVKEKAKDKKLAVITIEDLLRLKSEWEKLRDVQLGEVDLELFKDTDTDDTIQGLF